MISPRAGRNEGWRKSSYCQGASTTCVEVARHRDGVKVRDSKDPYGHTLSFSVEEWRTFVLAVRSGEFDI